MARNKNMSFLPEDYLEKRAARRTNIICISLFIIVVGGVVGAYGWTFEKRQEPALAEQARLDQRLQQAAAQLQQLEQLQNRKHTTRRKAAVTSALVERMPRGNLLAELVNHMPPQVGLLEFELDTEVVRERSEPRTSLQRRRRQIQQAELDPSMHVPQTRMNVSLVGVAPSDLEVSTYMESLTTHPLFENLNLEFSEEATIEKQEMRKFRIQMQVNGSIAIDQIEPTRVKRGLKQDPMADTMQISPDDALTPSGDVAPASDTQQQE